MVLRCSTSFSSAFKSFSNFETFEIRASGLSLTRRAVSSKSLDVFWTYLRAPSPVKASIRLTPEAMLDSLTIVKSPMSPVLPVWVPPQSSLLKSAKETTRTLSPYFSSKSAVAPDLKAASASISSVCVATFSRIRRLTRVSISASVSGSTVEKCVKSKRSRSGATSEPACLTCSPSTSRRTACRMWVAV